MNLWHQGKISFIYLLMRNVSLISSVSCFIANSVAWLKESREFFGGFSFKLKLFITVIMVTVGVLGLEYEA
jgi:hypothetical protein